MVLNDGEGIWEACSGVDKVVMRLAVVMKVRGDVELVVVMKWC